MLRLERGHPLGELVGESGEQPVLLDLGVGLQYGADPPGRSGRPVGVAGAVAALGVSVLTGARLHRALWLTLNGGAPAAVGFVHWLIWQPLYELNRLCPYCAVVWVVTIALCWYVTLRNCAHGVLPVPRRGRAAPNLALESRWLLPAGWYGVVVLLVLTRFWTYWSSPS